MRTLHLVGVLFLISIATASAALDPASILSPRPTGWVMDPRGVLSPEQVAEINALGDAVHARDGAEMAVVVVPTIGGGDHRAFATQLFNRWGIGSRIRNNGLLIFVAVDDRSAEIILGNGIHSDAQVAISDRIMQVEMVSRFRRGENAAAIVAGARACARELFGVSPLVGRTLSPETTDVEAARDALPPAAVSAQIEQSNRGARGLSIPGPAALGGLGAVGVVIALAARSWSRRPRRCSRCSMTMTRLSESEDDAHLNASEQLEERLGSVDYVIWLCPGCGGVDKVRRGAWFTKYSRCPQCGAATTSKAERTLSAATTLSGGLVEVHERCQNCSHANTFTRRTPRISTAPSRSGRSSSGFGGGRSSGRGSSGKW